MARSVGSSLWPKPFGLPATDQAPSRYGTVVHDLEAALGRLLRGVDERPGLLSITLPLPGLPLRTLAVPSGREGVSWEHSATRRQRLGLGVAVTAAFGGGDRFQRLDETFRRWQTGWTCLDPEGTGLAPRAFLGFAFLPGKGTGGPWEGMGGSLLSVPAVLVEGDGARWGLTFSVWKEPGWDRVGTLERWIADTLSVLGAGTDEQPERPLDLTRERNEPADQVWLDRVAEALRYIRKGDIDKVVLTRCTRVRADRPFQVQCILRWLESHYPECSLFTVSRNGATLIGASPERLLALEGRRLTCDALAGTVARESACGGGHGSGDTLLSDMKSRREHAFVVDAIRQALGPVCHRMVVPERPHVLTMPAVEHLWSPIQSQVRDGVSLLNLVDRLHPTPAVGGVPTGAALEVLSRLGEPNRGWYTGAVGWLQPNGDGALSVTLRCALLSGARANLFAGAGIVAGSEPQQELAETEWKLRTMLDALRAG